MKKRLLSLLLCLVMVFSLFPALGMTASATVSGSQHPEGKQYWANNQQMFQFYNGNSTYKSGLFGGSWTNKTTTVSFTVSVTISKGVITDYSVSAGYTDSNGSIDDNSYKITTHDTTKNNTKTPSTLDVRTGVNAGVKEIKDALETLKNNQTLITAASLTAALPTRNATSTILFQSNGGITNETIQNLTYAKIRNDLYKRLITNANPVYLYRWSNLNGNNDLDETWFEASPGTNIFYEGGVTPVKNSEVDEEGNTITYDFLGDWANDPDPNAKAVDTVVNEDTTFYALFHKNDPTAPILNEGMELSKSADYNNDNNTVTVDISAYAKGQTTSVLKAKEAQYAILVDLQAARADYTFAEMLPKDPVTKSGFTGYDSTSFEKPLFYYDASEDHYTSAKLVNINSYFNNTASINDYATAEDREIIQTVYKYRGDDFFGFLDRDGSIPYVLTYKDRAGKLHLVHDPDRNYNSITQIKKVTNYSGTATELWYKGVLFAQNSQNITGSQPNFFVSSNVQLYYVNDNVKGKPTRFEAMKQALKDFLAGLRTNTKAEVWIIGFDNMVRDNVTEKWINVSQNYKTLIKLVDDIQLNYTSSDIKAQKCGSYLAVNYANNTMLAGNSASARSVVLFQANPPTNVKDNDDAKRQNEGANLTIEAAKKIKDRGINIYSVGLIASEILPLQKFEGFIGTTYTEYTLDDYFQAVSSNYPAATALDSMGAKTTGVEYVQYANSQLDLTYAFNYIIDSTNESQATLDDSAILKDFIPLQNLDAHNATVTAKIVSKAAGEDQWDNNGAVDVPSENVTFDPDTGLVTVTGFDFAKNYVLSSDGSTGKKLAVKISGLVPLKTGTFDTNTKKSGIYGGEDGETFILAFEIPNVTVPETNGPVTKIVEYSAKTILATGVKSDNDVVTSRNENGSFGRTAEGKAYYLLKSDQASNLTLSGVDTALIRDGLSVWKAYNVIPASSVYFDDSLRNAEIDPNAAPGEYAAAIQQVNDNSTTVLEKGAARSFTFSGSRIDVYCTTDESTNSVYASMKMYDGDSLVSATDKDGKTVSGMLMNNRFTAGAFCNTPTVSFQNLDPSKTYFLTVKSMSSGDYRLDGVRVYGAVANDVYVEHNVTDEMYATYTKVRDILLEAKDFGAVNESGVAGAVFVNNVGRGENAAFGEYKTNGPKNEVYLDQGQGVAFAIPDYQAGMTVRIGLKSQDGTGKANVSNGDGNIAEIAVKSSTEVYYPITPDSNGNVIIWNATEGDNVPLISLTNVKVTGTAAKHNAPAMVVSSSLQSYVMMAASLPVAEPVVETVDEPGTVPTDAPEGNDESQTTDEPAPSDEPTPAETATPMPSLYNIVQQIVSSFVSRLFSSVSRLFGN